VRLHMSGRRGRTVLSIQRIADLAPAELAAVEALSQSFGQPGQSRWPPLDIRAETTRVYRLTSPDGTDELCVAPVNEGIGVGATVQPRGRRARQAQYAKQGRVIRAIAPERLAIIGPTKPRP